MKILKKEGNYRKVTVLGVFGGFVTNDGWGYSTRSEWKENVRDVNKKVTVEVAEVKKSKKK